MDREATPMSSVWKTKYGPRRVRHDPPTVEEAIVAATDRPGTAEKAARPKRTADSRKPRKRAVRPRPFTIEDLFAGRPFPVR